MFGEMEASNCMESVHGFLKSFRYLFLKKLSTGSDEAYFHKKQILGLNELIEKKEREVKSKRKELMELKERRKVENEEKKKDIEELKTKLNNVDNIKKNRFIKMKETNIEQQKINQKIHLERVRKRNF